MKIIEISCCGKCPYLDRFLSCAKCVKLRYKKIEDLAIIDKDCPLQDKEEK